ncbi:DUF6512 family protein [Xylanivirga thermophila]|uniref:DUF6512 family protein n=1 Tax=Xylanivirga thermophila TaxID=2496273 RepID=UPI00101CC378|nr:DUF6512 family protein [Xylanivirga thermophila]
MGNIKKRVLIWEIIGVFWIIGIGSLLHFVYEWSGNSNLVAFIAPVNESLWEHLKLGYWSLVLFSLIEYWFIRYDVTGFFLGKALGIATLELFVVAVFYTYKAITGKNILWIDIVSYVVGAILCQLVSLSILKKKSGKSGEVAGGIILIVFGILFMVFTFYTPHLPIFKDPVTGGYGVIK